MPSPQALVAFSLSLFVLLVVLRAQLGLGPNVAAAIAILASLGVGAVVDRLVPPEPDEETDLVEEEVAAEARPAGGEGGTGVVS
jgi:hypothetical protein